MSPFSDGVLQAIDACLDGFASEPALTVTEWADEHRVLHGRGASEAGPWRTARTPYLKEIMDALSPSHPAQRIVFMKGAQVGGTEAGNNFLGFVIHHAPGPALSVSPTVEMAKRSSQQRIDPMIEVCPALSARIAPARKRDSGNTVLSKEFPGGILVMTGANSAVGLRSMPARYLFLDEVDAYPDSADDEGDPINLAVARTRTFSYRRKILMVSTPKFQGTSRIEREYLRTDQRRYFLKCPSCGHRQHLQFQHLKWTKGEPETAAYVCEKNGCVIEERHKPIMLATGEWCATNVKPDDPRAIGFHLNSLYSPLGWMSWAEIARQWEAAQASVETIKEFVNTVEGRTFKLPGEVPDWQRLYDRREDWPDNKLPAGALFLTAGVDVQRDRIEARVIAWGRGRQSWLADRRILMGDTSRAETWAQLNEVLDSSWPHVSGAELKIARMAVDSGYAAAEVYRWAKRHPARVLVIKGMPDGFRQPIGVPALAEVAGRKRSRSGTKVWPVGGGYIKEMLYGWLRLDAPVDGQPYPPGYVHLPKWADDSEIKQITSEELVTEKTRHGFAKQVWSKVRERNEALDCWIYAYAAACQIGIERFGDARWQQFEMTLGEPAPPPSATAPAPADRPQDEAGAAQEAPARKVVLPVGPAKRQRQVVMRSL